MNIYQLKRIASERCMKLTSLRWFFVFAVTIGFCFLTSAAKTETNYLSKVNLISSYIERTSLTLKGGLTRPTLKKPSNINFTCVADHPCDEAVKALSKFLQTPWLSLQSTQKVDENALVNLIFFSDAKSADQKRASYTNLTFSDGQKVFGEGPEECKVYGVATDTEIVRIVISVNVTIPQKHIVSCVLGTLARSSGLAFFPSYLDQWKANGELANASEDTYVKTMNGTARLLAIHFSPYTRPGMTVEEFLAETSKMSVWDMLGK